MTATSTSAEQRVIRSLETSMSGREEILSNELVVVYLPTGEKCCLLENT